MPFKTRKQKESAKKRRVKFLEGGLVSYEARRGKDETEEKTSEVKAKNVLKIENSYNFVKRDFFRILLFGSIIIGLQIALKITNISFF